MMRMRPALILLFALLVAGCGTASDESGSVARNASTLAAAPGPAPSLYGRWTIVAVDGAPPLRLDMTDARRPSLTFSASRYGGSTGCNSFGGTGLLVGDRWFGEPPIATEQGCGPLTAQENRIIGVAAGGPVVSFDGPAEATLTSAAGSLRLRRDDDDPAGGADAAPMLLAGTAWEVRAVDGVWSGSRQGREMPLLTFEADRWTLTGLCAPLSGSWRQTGQAVRMDLTAGQPRACASGEAAADAAMRSLFAAGPRYVVGPNRELVMAGGGHWLAGQFDRAFGGDAKAMLRGEWRVDTIDGIAPDPAGPPPSLAFGSAGYAIRDGCNHSEGVMLVLARQLFTRGSGVSTLAQCAPDPFRPRLRAIVAGNPRIATTDAGGLALVAPVGTLRLTRLSGRAFGAGEQLGLRGPRTIALLAPQARLELSSASRFAVVLACGRIEGDWRGGQPARFSPDPIERTAPNCPRGPGSDALRLGQFLPGNVHAVTGPNRDIVLLVNEDRSIAGRVAS